MGEESSVIFVGTPFYLVITTLFADSAGVKGTAGNIVSTVAHTIDISSVWVQGSGDLVGLVADVLFAVAAADSKPSETTANGFDKIPGVEGVN